MTCCAAYDENQAKSVERAVIGEFGCTISEIACVADTVYKKIVVYVLYAILGFEKRNVGHAYSITWLFVPTVAEAIESAMLGDENLRMRIFNVLDKISVPT